MELKSKYRLTQYSHGAGCGCKISPAILSEIIGGNIVNKVDPRLLVGNDKRDDAAVYDMGNGEAIISTTDFFMPIVDDPYDFGCIAAANAISDVYAMGGTPFLAIAILGWPLDKLPPQVANEVMKGAIDTCERAGISLGGGHSIDSPEPIFGLAVTGRVKIANIKTNAGAKPGDLIILTKPLGVGILTTAEKKGLLSDEHQGLAANQMKQLNSIGQKLSDIEGVHAITDVTGFGLSGHLIEMMEASGTAAQIDYGQLPLIVDTLAQYIAEGSVPGGTLRNWESYGSKVHIENKNHEKVIRSIIADPQTSGGLLIAIDPISLPLVTNLFERSAGGYYLIGKVAAIRNDSFKIICQ